MFKNHQYNEIGAEIKEEIYSDLLEGFSSDAVGQ